MNNFICSFYIIISICCKIYVSSSMIDHTVVTRSDIFPYMAAILKKSQYISAGALIHEQWVLTAADSLFLIEQNYPTQALPHVFWMVLAIDNNNVKLWLTSLQESARLIQVRLGSVNYKKGGILVPVKLFEIHPYFDDNRPQYDLAMIQLSRKVVSSPTRSPIRWEKSPREKSTTHYIVTAWPATIIKTVQDHMNIESMESIKRRRMLTVSHLHPSDRNKCLKMLGQLGPNATEALICLDPDTGVDSCLREVGAPVVLNGVLKGIISSYKPEDCPSNPSYILANKISSKDHKSWILSTIHGHRWIFKEDFIESEEFNKIEHRKWL